MLHGSPSLLAEILRELLRLRDLGVGLLILYQHERMAIKGWDFYPREMRLPQSPPRVPYSNANAT